MDTIPVRVLCDIYCKYQEPHPRYRIYVGNELFTERTWIWEDMYLEEHLQIEAPLGRYPIEFEVVDPSGTAKFKIKNIRILDGPAFVDDNNVLEIFR